MCGYRNEVGSYCSISNNTMLQNPINRDWSAKRRFHSSLCLTYACVLLGFSQARKNLLLIHSLTHSVKQARSQSQRIRRALSYRGTNAVQEPEQRGGSASPHPAQVEGPVRLPSLCPPLRLLQLPHLHPPGGAGHPYPQDATMRRHGPLQTYFHLLID